MSSGAKMSLYSTITSKGQITVPKEVRERLGLREGDTIAFIPIDGSALLLPRNKPAESIFGLLSEYAKPGATLEDYDEAVRSAVASHVAGRDGAVEDSAA